MSSLPTSRVLSATLDSDEEEIVKLEVLEVVPGQVMRLQFEEVASDWRQGVWLAAGGELVTGGERSPQFVLWSDTAPPEVEVTIADTDGFLRLYNVWDSGRGLGTFESQSATSGMIAEVLGDGRRRYRCNDIGQPPDFGKLSFVVKLTHGGSD